MSWTFLPQRLHYMSNLEVNMEVGDLVELIGYPYIGVVKEVYIDYETDDNVLVVVTADGRQWSRRESQFYLLEDQ
jgi:hypothetical protein